MVGIQEGEMKKFVVLLVLASTIILSLTMIGCGGQNVMAPVVSQNTEATMDWYAAHQDEITTVTMDEMVSIINRAYVAYPDSAIGLVRQFIWEELKKAKQMNRAAEPNSAESSSIYSLNWQETLLLISEPWNGPPTNTCRNLAVSETNSQWPGYSQFQDKADGFRHAYWNVLMCIRINEDWARKFSSAHEYGAVNGLLDAQMDLNNNGVGRALWRTYFRSKTEAQYSSIIKGWRYVKVSSFNGAVPYIIYLVG